jgi:hypothetical protein
MKIGFTGTRVGMSASQRTALGAALRSRKDEITEFHHGDCVGADAEAHHIAAAILGVEKIFIHPPEIQKRRAFCQSPNILPPLGYLERDLAIVLATDMLIGCPKAGNPAPRSGTWYTIRRAKERGKAVLIFLAGD